MLGNSVHCKLCLDFLWICFFWRFFCTRSYRIHIIKNRSICYLDNTLTGPTGQNEPAVMAMKGYISLPNSQKLEPHSLMQFSVTYRIPFFWWGVRLSQGYRLLILNTADKRLDLFNEHVWVQKRKWITIQDLWGFRVLLCFIKRNRKSRVTIINFTQGFAIHQLIIQLILTFI